MCGEGKRQGGKAQCRLWGLDFYRVLLEPADTPRRHPLIALLGNPGLKVLPRPPDRELSPVPGTRLPVSLLRRKTLHNEI